LFAVVATTEVFLKPYVKVNEQIGFPFFSFNFGSPVRWFRHVIRITAQL
jgi:hypothetical protein